MSLHFRSSHVSLKLKKSRNTFFVEKSIHFGTQKTWLLTLARLLALCLVSNTVHLTFSPVPGKQSHREGGNGIDGF